MIFFSVLSLRRVLVCLFVAVLSGSSARGQEALGLLKPVPRLAVVPMPYQQASFQRDGVEITRYHFGGDLNRPYLFPVIGPSGRPLTRMGHPRDPESHSHHNSVWISHTDVNGVDFWGDGGKGKIRHKRIIKYEDGGESSAIVTENEWVTAEGGRLLDETRQVTVLLLEGKEWLMVIDMELKAVDKPVTLGKTPFGMIGVRMAKTIGVNDGGGRIRNSEGGVNEKEIFWKQARWVDYSGAVTDSAIEGVTLFDHPKNVNFPSFFHVRNDGWMGASLTFEGPRTIEADKPLRLRYGLYVHGDMKPIDAIEAQWKKFAELGPLTNLEGPPQEK